MKDFLAISVAAILGANLRYLLSRVAAREFGPVFPTGTLIINIIGSFIVARTWQAASRRARLPETARPDAGLYIDECQNFLNLPYPLEDMLAEARAYRLAVTMAHQNLAQLPPDLRQGISANARSQVIFSASPEDARDLEHHTAPVLTAHDLSHLDAYQAAARLVASSAETPRRSCSSGRGSFCLTSAVGSLLLPLGWRRPCIPARRGA